MKRFVSVWLPRWPIERLARASPAALPGGVPLALVEDRNGRRLLVAVEDNALRAGVVPGMALPDARAVCPALHVRAAERSGDHAGLRRLARWCGRYGPNRNAVASCEPEPGDDYGIWIDITGVAHLFGGEAALLADISARLARAGLTARLGLADTYGAAHALARHATGAVALAPAGGTAAALAPLPVAGLRLTGDSEHLLRRLGLRRIGDLYGLPRAALERRFRAAAPRAGSAAARHAAPAQAAAVVARLDAALGLLAEPMRPLGLPPRVSARRAFAEPLIASTSIVAAAAEVIGELCASLAAADLAARRLRLSLYRSDGTLAAVEVGICRPCRDAGHLMRLMDGRLDTVDAGFGIDLVAAEAFSVVVAQGAQMGLAAASAEEGLARLVDVLVMRLGGARVHALVPQASHIPERAQRRSPPRPAVAAGESAWPSHGLPRPPLLFAAPEPIAVIAEIPEGPPRHFTWRRLVHRVTRAQGPERIAPEWWRQLPPARTEPAARRADDGRTGAWQDDEPAAADRPRDYYRVEVEGGARLWIFRDGRYDAQGAPPRWFVHGLFG